MIDVIAGQRVMADVLTDERSRRAWATDPASYASDRLAGPEAAMVAGLRRGGLHATAAVIADKRANAASGEQGASRAIPPREEMEAIAATVPSRRRPELGPAKAVATGCGYRPALLRHLWRRLNEVEVWEHTIDVYLNGGRDGVRELARMSSSQPVVLHSLDLSVGSPAARSCPERLAAIREMAHLAGVDELSDHLGFSRIDDRRLHDFVPLWRVEEQLDLVVANVAWLQDFLGVRLVLENPSVLFDPGGELGWAEFANEIVARTGCGLLLDISNLLLDQANGLRDAATELDRLDMSAVTEVHLAGGETSGGIFWDAHHSPVPSDDLAWLSRLLPRMGNCRTVVVERDGRFDMAEELIADLEAVRSIVAGVEVRP